MTKRMGKFSESNLIAQSIELLSRNEKVKISILLIVQVFLNFLDLIALAVIGILGSITISGLNSNDVNPIINRFLHLLSISEFTLQNQVLFLSVLFVTSLILKTTLSAYISKKTTHYLARRSAEISNDFYTKLLTPTYVHLILKNGQDAIYKLTTGTNSIILGVINNLLIFVTDFSLLIILSFALFYVDAVMAISSLLLFCSVAYSLYIKLRTKAETLGVENSKLTTLNNSLILSSLNNYRQIYLRGSESYFVANVSKNNLQLAKVNAEGNVLPFTSKYFIETAMVVGFSIITFVQFLMYDTNHAVSVLAVFMAASMRIMPAVLRIQNSAVRIKLASGMAKDSLKMLRELKPLKSTHIKNPKKNFLHLDFDGEVLFNNVSFKYSDTEEFTLENVNFKISSGEFVAFVGPSGSGKSTLLDLITGLKIPSTGEVLFSGHSPRETIDRWPGAIAYVPQSVDLINGTIRENLCLGFPSEDFKDDYFWEILDLAQLSEFVKGLPKSLDTFLTEKETNLSGGQIQRLGIARALFTKPKILILDEATSSLDLEVEKVVVQNLDKLKGHTTLIVVAHRISTISGADKVYKIEKGKVTINAPLEA